MTYVYELREYSSINTGSFTSHGFFSTLPPLKAAALSIVHAKTEERCTPKDWGFIDRTSCRNGDTSTFLGTFFTYNRHKVTH